MQTSVAQQTQEVVAESTTTSTLPAPLELDLSVLQHVSGGAAATNGDENAPRGTWQATNYSARAPRGTW